MYNKYLVLKFRNAKLFRNRMDGSCKDYVFDLTIKKGYRKRMDKRKGIYKSQIPEKEDRKSKKNGSDHSRSNNVVSKIRSNYREDFDQRHKKKI